MKSGVALDPQQHPHRMELMLLLFYRPLICREDGGIRTMGDYGWSMDSDTPQGIDAVEYGRVLEYPKRRNKTGAELDGWISDPLFNSR